MVKYIKGSVTSC